MANNNNPMEGTEKSIQADRAKASFVDFEPYCAWQRGEENDSLAVHLHGFTRELIKVQVNNHRILIINGQRPIDDTNDNTFTRFTKQIKLPNNCDEKRISAKFAFGVLSITMPKKDESTSAKAHNDQVTGEPMNDTPEKKTDNCIVERAMDKSDSKKGLMKMVGKVAVVVLVIAVSGAYVHACMGKKRRQN